MQTLKKYELEPCEHLESVKDSWVHNMFQEKTLGAQSEAHHPSPILSCNPLLHSSLSTPISYCTDTAL